MKSEKTKGFTLIELLIVIAVLGVLAVAVLSAINPIEQIKRARDTASKSDTEQLINAIDRYNASQLRWPWMDTDTDQQAVLWTVISGTEPAGSKCTMFKNLGKQVDITCPGADEIKQAFITRITTAAGYNKLYIEYGGQPGDSVYVCFNPQSGAMTTEATTRCTEGVPTDFPANACGSCPKTSMGKSDNCICLP